MTHDRPGSIFDRSSGDEAANSYEFYPKDVQALKETGVRALTKFLITLRAFKIIFTLVQLLSIFNCMVTRVGQKFATKSGWN